MNCIGTAGHVDHGKSTLVTALTGMDPDRLAEEKARGMTIDLGFAWLTLPSGREVSIVDVPGHESFIKNMLAGVGGIDAALLVVAADEGVMPQTREHLAILDLLQVPTGVVALTKCDLVEEEEWLELVRAEVLELLKPTTLADAPIINCSAATGEGLGELLEALDTALATPNYRDEQGHPRLPVDRAFTITGFGTVVTGTLQDGRLRVGQEVQIYPGERRARIRSLQSHKQAIEEGLPGGRMAANLVGIATTEVERGNVLALPGSLRPTIALDARLEVIAAAAHPLLHNTELEVYAGAAEVPGRVLLLDSEQLRPGETGWAQLRLGRPLALVRGDRFILRTPSPSATIGGGIVVDSWAVRHRRHDVAALARLEQLAQTDPEEVVLATLLPLKAVRSAPHDSSSRSSRRPGRYYLHQIQTIALTSGLAEAEIEVALSALAARGQVTRTGTFNILQSEWERLAAAAVTLVSSYHQRFPLRLGMPREEWRSRLDLSPRAADEVLATLAECPTAVEAVGHATDRSHGALVRLHGFQPHMTTAEQEAATAMLERFQRDPWNPPIRPEVEAELGPELTATLVDQGKLVRVSDVILLAPDVYARAIDQLVSYLRTQPTITAAQARDLLHTSRKYVLAFLEHLDARHITRRQGDDRVLGPNAPATGTATSSPETDG